MAQTWLTVAQVAELPPGSMQAVDVQGRRVLVCHTPEGFFAVDDVCSHDEGPLSGGALDGCEVECPRHGARFDARTGAVLCLPAAVPVRTYPLRVEKGDIQVMISETLVS